MKAVVLAAGRGSRLMPLTEKIPKSMVAFNGVPLLHRNISSLRIAGIEEIAVVTGYQSNAVVCEADALIHNAEWETSGIFASLERAKAWLNGSDFILSYGDIFFDGNDATNLIAARGNIVTLYDPNAVELWCQRMANPLEDLERFEIDGNLIKAIGSRPTSLHEVQGQYIGLTKFSCNGYQEFSNVAHSLLNPKTADITSALSAVINSGGEVHGIPCNGRWGEIDTPEDLALYEKLAYVQ